MSISPKLEGWLIFFGALLLCTSFIGLYPIYILDESRNAEAAREMFVTGNYVVPYFNEVLRTDKPPFHYFFMVLGYQLFGINPFGARFFSGVFGALTVFLAYWFTKRHLGLTHAGITALLLLSSLWFVQEFHLAVPDPYLIFFISSSLFGFYEFYTTQKKSWLWMAYGCIGLGMLTKGPIALVLPGLVMLVFLVARKGFNFKTILSFRPILGLLLVFSIAAPWYYLVHVATEGEWTRGFFLDHNVNRFNSGREGHGGLFVLTPLFVILGLLPFSVFIIQGFAHGWQQRKANDFILFSFIIAWITVMFFSMASTKLPNYPMPCYPFIAILIASYLETLLKQSKSPSKWIYWSLGFLALVSLALPIGAWLFFGSEERFRDLQWFSLLLLVLPISTFLGWKLYRQKQLKNSFLSICGGWMLLGGFLFGLIYPALTVKNPVEMVKKYAGRSSEIIVFQRFDSAFPFNFNRTFPVAHTMKEVELYLKNYPDAFIITNTRSKENLRQLKRFRLILEQKALFENHTTRVYKK